MRLGSGLASPTPRRIAAAVEDQRDLRAGLLFAKLGQVMAAIAVIGAGSMGSRMARRLLDAGHELIVWNRTASRAVPLTGAGAALAARTAEAAAAAEIAITMLRDPRVHSRP